MQGHYILNKRPRHFQRVDFILTTERYLTSALLIFSSIIAAILVARSLYDAAITLFVFAFGISSVLLSIIQNRQVQVTEYAQSTLLALQARWDELRTDDFLLESLTNPQPVGELSLKTKFRLRLYLASFLDVQALIIHYIRRGYFRHTREYAIIYEKMIKSIFECPYFIDIWRGNGTWGIGCLSEEFGKDLTYVVNCIIHDIEDERSMKSNSDIVGLASPKEIHQP